MNNNFFKNLEEIESCEDNSQEDNSKEHNSEEPFYLLVAFKNNQFSASDWKNLVDACNNHPDLPRGAYALNRVEGLLGWPSQIFDNGSKTNDDHQIRLHWLAPKWNGVATKLYLGSGVDPEETTIVNSRYCFCQHPMNLSNNIHWQGPAALYDYGKGDHMEISPRGWLAITQILQNLGHYVEGKSDSKRAQECGATGVGGLKPTAYVHELKFKTKGKILGQSSGEGDPKYPKCLGYECWCVDCIMQQMDTNDRNWKTKACDLAISNQEIYNDYRTGLKTLQRLKNSTLSLKNSTLPLKNSTLPLYNNKNRKNKRKDANDQKLQSQALVSKKKYIKILSQWQEKEKEHAKTMAAKVKEYFMQHQEPKPKDYSKRPTDYSEFD
jgi:hypothetical protein